MELKLAYAAMRILYKITKYRVGRGGFNRPHNVVNGSLRSLRCYVLLGKRSFSIDCTGLGIKSFSLRCKMWYQYQKKYSNIIFERKKYLDELIAGRGNGLVKIITGVRRSGKSFLLFDIWHNWLLEHGVTDNHIIEIQLDDFRNRRLRKPDALLDYIDSKVVDDGKPDYLAYKSK